MRCDVCMKSPDSVRLPCNFQTGEPPGDVFTSQRKDSVGQDGHIMHATHWSSREQETVVPVVEGPIEWLAAAVDSRDENVRWQAMQALAHRGDRAAAEILLGVVRKRKGHTRAAAGSALISIGEPAVLPVIDALDDPVPDVRWAAARILRSSGDARALPVLKTVEQHETGTTREGYDVKAMMRAAIDAIEKALRRKGDRWQLVME